MQNYAAVNEDQDSYDAFERDYLDLAQAAQRVGIHPQTLRRIAKRGDVPFRTFTGKMVFNITTLDQWASTYDPRPGRPPGPVSLFALPAPAHRCTVCDVPLQFGNYCTAHKSAYFTAWHAAHRDRNKTRCGNPGCTNLKSVASKQCATCWSAQQAAAQAAKPPKQTPTRERTHCPKGHPYTPDNLIAASLRLGTRHCRTCHNAYTREKARNRTPEEKALAAARAKDYHRAYYQRAKSARQQPEAKARQAARARAYYARPDVKARILAAKNEHYQRRKAERAVQE